MLWRETYQSGLDKHENLINYTSNLLINVALNRKINFTTDRNTGLVDLTFNMDTWQYDQTDWYTEWLTDEMSGKETKKTVISKIQS